MESKNKNGSVMQQDSLTVRQSCNNIPLHSFLHSMGFYGFYSIKTAESGAVKVKYRLGYKFSTFLWPGAFELEFGYVKTTPGSVTLTYIPGFFRYQNQVSLDSPLMTACRYGTVEQVSQILRQRKGSVRDRAICGGKTPLLVGLLVQPSSIPY